MNRIRVGIGVCVGLLGLVGPGPGRADEDEAAKGLKRLEGVWASMPSKTGRGRGHVLVFQGGRMGWQSSQPRDGDPVIGDANLYEVRLDPKASPRKLTVTRGSTLR